MEQDQKAKTNTFTFAGFASPNFTQVPDELFDQLLPLLSGAELKVLLYVVRRTFGFKKGSDRISKSQLEGGIARRDGEVLDGGTGLSRRAIRLAVQSLVEKHILLKNMQFSAAKGNEATEYALNIIGHNPGVLNTPGEGQKVPKPLGRGVPPQYTVKQDINTYVDVGLNRPAVVDNSVAKSDPTPMSELIHTRSTRFAAESTTQPHTDSSLDRRTDVEAHEDDLIDQLMDQLGDGNLKSRKSYRMILRALGSSITLRLLANTKEAHRDGIIRGGNKAGYFIGMAKNEALKQGVVLGFHTRQT